MVVCDALAEDDTEKAYDIWAEKFAAARQDIITFVSERVASASTLGFGRISPKFYEIDMALTLDSQPEYMIRFPNPANVATRFLEDQIWNEVQVMGFLREKTTIPVAEVYDWGMTKDSPSQLGPYIIMEFVKGKKLFDEMRRKIKTEKDEVAQHKIVGNPKMVHVYEQYADYMLQLNKLEFDAAGAIEKNVSGGWEAIHPPLTSNMSLSAHFIGGYPNETFPEVPFSSAKAYLHHIVDKYITVLNTQRNIANDDRHAEMLFIAYHRLKQLVERYCLDETENCRFKLNFFNMRSLTIIVDDEMNIKALVDFGFSNAWPAQFAYDPPWWLTVLSPIEWLRNEYHIKAFKMRYEPHLEVFLKAVEKKEAERNYTGGPLSAKMRDSWTSGRFRFNQAFKDCWDVETLYWNALHITGDEVLDEEMREEMRSFVNTKMRSFFNTKMKQMRNYEIKCIIRRIRS